MQSKPYKRQTFSKQFFSKTSRMDWWMLGLTVCLVSFGLIMIYEASSVAALRSFGDRFHFLREQLKWVIVGFTGMVVFLLLPYKKLYTLAIPFLIVTLALLIGVFLPGLGVHALGARRWINLGILSIQPAEFAKLALVIYLAAWFSRKEKGRLLSFLTLITMVVGLVILEPDLGTAIVILAIAGILYFISGAPLYHFALLIPVIFTGLIILSLVSPYRLSRIETFFNPSIDPLGTSYHARQIVISLGSGGWFGRGLGKSLQKYDFLPEATTDSIFAIIAEEFGFIGSVGIISLFIIFMIRGFKIASQATDHFGRLLASGLITWFSVQTMINLSAMVVLLPITGIPLPLISYGGSSLVVMLASIGVLLNISRASSK